MADENEQRLSEFPTVSTFDIFSLQPDDVTTTSEPTEFPTQKPRQATKPVYLTAFFLAEKVPLVLFTSDEMKLMEDSVEHFATPNTDTASSSLTPVVATFLDQSKLQSEISYSQLRAMKPSAENNNNIQFSLNVESFDDFMTTSSLLSKSVNENNLL